MKWYSTQLRNGISIEEIRLDMARSTEGRGVVNGIYQEVLCREGEQEGLAFYVDHLGRDLSVWGVREIMRQSPEYLGGQCLCKK